MRLILVENERILGSAIQNALRREAYGVDWVVNGRDLGEALKNYRYDMAVLSLDLPDETGEVLLQRMQKEQANVPVVAVSAPGHRHDSAALLDLGADDFVVKPFELTELTARLRAVARRLRSEDADGGASVHGPLRLMPLRRSVTFDGKTVPLTHREFSVLEVLMRRKNQVLTRAQIEEALYGWNDEVVSNAVEVHIHMLRRKLGSALIHTVRGVGYQLASVTQAARKLQVEGGRSADMP